MIFGTNSNYMLKYQKAKAKLVEYDISQKDYPKFPLNSNELSYPVIYILSRYAESIIENDETGKAEFAPYMVKASQYFDASVGANDRTAYDTDFLLSGAAAYFLSNDFGSSKVLCAALFEKIKDTPTMGTSQIILRNLLGYLLLDKVFPISSDTFGGEELCRALLFYYTNGEGLPNIEQAIRKYRTAIYKNNDPMEIYYVDILLAVITIALSKAAWKLIPQYSKLEPGQWEEYLKSSKSPKMLWPAQQLIGKKNVLSGENAIVQLPTGVGKTKSIELIIRSSFLSNRTATAIIVAPLRALCNEIASDMTSAFGESVLINQFSDILENDFFVDFTLKATILICTPEKLSYIIHHQVEFLDEIGLYIFDESHMFDDGRRGTAYELLISEIRKHINPGDCDGQSGYGVSKLDSIVEEVVRQIFAQFREVSRKKLLESVKTNDAARIQKKVKKIQKDLESKQKELDDLKAETILVIRGVSALDKELLGTLVAEAREALETLEKQLVQAQEEYEEATKTAKRSNYMIKNKGYTGYLINGAVETECPQLRIIEPELFEQAQELRQARTCERGGTSLGTSSKALLTGLVYCAHCGNRLSLTSSGRTHTYADGHTVKEVRPRYSCFYKIRHPGDCDGQSGYGVSKLDSIVEEVVRQIFAQFREVSRKKLLESVKTNDAARIQKKIKKIQKDLEAKQKELDDLKAETILVIRGVSALDKELLGTLVAEAREALETLEKQLVQAQEEYEETTKTAKRSNYICNELFTWADVYDTANHDERRAILQQFIKEIRVRKDYEISITLNASFDQVEQLKAVSTYDGAEIFEEISEKGA